MAAACEPLAGVFCRTALLAVCSTALVCSAPPERDAPACAASDSAPRANVTPPPAPPVGLGAHLATVGEREFVVFSHPRLRVTLDRPTPDDARVVLAVAGTYTGKDGRAMGFFAIDGEVRQSSKMPWEGLVRIYEGIPDIVMATKGDVDVGDGASIFQGHLLVHDGEVRPLKPSDPTYRRALTTDAFGRFAIVDGRTPQSLHAFAEDLVELGAHAALNLDMGAWSGGFYRDPVNRRLVPLGHNTTATDRQTNWLVFDAAASLSEPDPRAGR